MAGFKNNSSTDIAGSDVMRGDTLEISSRFGQETGDGNLFSAINGMGRDSSLYAGSDYFSSRLGKIGAEQRKAGDVTHYQFDENGELSSVDLIPASSSGTPSSLDLDLD